jgi:ketosteroid isomerase-like protein
MSQQNLELAQAADEAWNTGDWNALSEVWDPSIVVRTTEEWPERGIFGLESALRWAKELRATWDVAALETIHRRDAGDRVVARQVLRGAGHGPASRIEVTTVATIRKGKIVLLEYFWDHAEALEALGLQKREMPSESAEGCVRRIFEGANNRDAAAIQSACDPDFELTSRFSAVEGATYRGHAGIVDYLADLETAWEGIRWTLEELIPAGEEKLIVVAHTQGIARGSGVPVDERGYSTWELRQGKALRAHVYTSRDAALEAIGLSDKDNIADSS